MNKKFIITTFLICFTVIGCDIYTPQKNYTLVIPENDYFYEYVSTHLVPFLESNDFSITIVSAKNAIDANIMVARGDADLCMINNNSVPATDKIGPITANLRTVLPLTTRLLFAFSKVQLPDSATVKELFEGKRIGIELLGGEAQLNLEHFIASAKIVNTKIVATIDNPDVIVLWGTFYGERTKKLLDEGWHPFSFKNNWIEFLTLNDPSLTPYKLPAIPGDDRSIPISTVATETILVTNNSIGENSIYELSQTIFQNKLALMHEDIMYRNIKEDFNQDALLYPLHEGTTSFLRRDQPTFFERYADTIALVLSVIAVLYGGFQAIRNKLAKQKKDQVDKYFIEFLEIRQSKNLQLELKVKKLDDLFQRAVEQMTHEKLEKSDFHILSRLIQQELTILRFN